MSVSAILISNAQQEHISASVLSTCLCFNNGEYCRLQAADRMRLSATIQLEFVRTRTTMTYSIDPKTTQIPQSILVE